MRYAALTAIAALATSGLPFSVPSFDPHTGCGKLPHWIRGSTKIRRSTKNWRYYQKRIERRRRNAGR